MERYSNSTREVAQDGRRGALMLSVSINHPDAEDFINAKLEQGKVTGANVSVRIDDNFMKAVKNGEEYTQKYPIFSADSKVSKSIDANALWKKIVHNAWKSAEPGILFWDTIINESVPDCYADLGYKTVSTNPCGEIPLCPYDSCRLLAINLFSYVDNPFTDKAKFNFELFKKHVGIAQRIMDDIIDLELEKIDNILKKIDEDPELDDVKATEYNLWLNIKKKAQEGRRTGVGITAEGDMLAALGIQYGSETGNAFSLEVHKTIAIEAYRSSVYLAKERGAFSIFDAEREKENPFIQRLKEADSKLYYEMLEYGRRNIALLTIAPTGTTSLMTQTTSGIEPVFMPVYKRRRKVNPNDKHVRIDFVDELGDSWEEYVVFHNRFKQWMEVNGIDSSKNFSQEEMDALIKKSPYYKATANDVDWLSKVSMQGAIQKWVDHSISVTINLPNNVSEELVGELYLKAWEVGCKGVTVYREGSRSGVLISNDEKNEDKTDDKLTIFPTKRPQTLEADVVRFQNSKEKWIAFIGLIDEQPYEVFTGLADDEDGILIPRWVNGGVIIKNRNEDGSSRYDFQYKNTRGYKTTIEGLSHKFNPEFWNYAKLISSTLRHGMPIDKIVDLINSLQLDSASINTWKNGVGRALKRYVEDGTKAKGQACDNCKSENLIYQEGCLTCKDCGSSKCG
jgi:ribonucleoside-diphosphate reductase alpha chain